MGTDCARTLTFSMVIVHPAELRVEWWKVAGSFRFVILIVILINTDASERIRSKIRTGRILSATTDHALATCCVLKSGGEIPPHL